MNAKLDERALTIARQQASDMLAANWEDICRARDMAAIQASRQGKDKFTYSTTLTIKQEPRGDEIVISTGISCSVAFKDETEPVSVSNQLDMGI